MEKLLFFAYKGLSWITFGKILLSKTEYEIRRYLPFDSYGIGVRTIGLFLKNTVSSFLIFFFSLGVIAKWDVHYIFSSFYISIASYYNRLISWKRVQEKRLLFQLSDFLGELRHAYDRREDVEEAFSEAFHLAGEELKLHLGLFEEAFEYGGIPESYKVVIPNKFFLVLLSICQSTIRYGDTDMIFLSNLDELQKNIDSDLLKWERENFFLHSLFLVLTIPILGLPWMERWAVFQIRELSFFYRDFRGSLVRLAILALSFPVFLFLLKMKETEQRGIHPFLDYFLESVYIQKLLRFFCKNKTETQKGMKEIFAKYFPMQSYLRFLFLRIICGMLGFVLSSFWLIYWRYSFIWLLFSAIFSIGCSFIPYLSIAIEGMYYEYEIEEEIGGIRLMFGILSGVSGINAEEMLYWTEEFSTYLKESVSECLDLLGTDEDCAYRRLREQWRNTSFMSMVDHLIASDKIGIQEAFKDLQSRREYYMAKRRQEQEFITIKKEAILQTFLYLPFMAAVFLYLILPFLYLSMTNLLEITRSLR